MSARPVKAGRPLPQGELVRKALLWGGELALVNGKVVNLGRVCWSYFTVPLHYCPTAASTSLCAPSKRVMASLIVWLPMDGLVRGLLHGVHLSGNWAVFFRVGASNRRRSDVL